MRHNNAISDHKEVRRKPTISLTQIGFILLGYVAFIGSVINITIVQVMSFTPLVVGSAWFGVWLSMAWLLIATCGVKKDSDLKKQPVLMCVLLFIAVIGVIMAVGLTLVSLDISYGLIHYLVLFLLPMIISTTMVGSIIILLTRINPYFFYNKKLRLELLKAVDEDIDKEVNEINNQEVLNLCESHDFYSDYNPQQYEHDLYPNKGSSDAADTYNYDWREDIMVNKSDKGKWIYLKHHDILRKRLIDYATKKSLNRIIFPSPYTVADGSDMTIEIRHATGGLVSVALKVTKGQITSNNHHKEVVNVRFDNNDEVHTYEWQTGERCRSVIIYKDAVDFIERLKKSNHVLIELPFYVDSKTILCLFKFETTGLEWNHAIIVSQTVDDEVTEPYKAVDANVANFFAVDSLDIFKSDTVENRVAVTSELCDVLDLSVSEEAIEAK